MIIPWLVLKMESSFSVGTPDGDLTYTLISNEYDENNYDDACLFDALSSWRTLLDWDPVVLEAKSIRRNWQVRIPGTIKAHDSGHTVSSVDSAESFLSVISSMSDMKRDGRCPRQLDELPISLLRCEIVVVDLFNQIGLSYMLVSPKAKVWYVGNDEDAVLHAAIEHAVMPHIATGLVHCEQASRHEYVVTGQGSKVSATIRTTTIGSYIHERRTYCTEPDQVDINFALSKHFKECVLSEWDFAYRYGKTPYKPDEFPG